MSIIPLREIKINSEPKVKKITKSDISKIEHEIKVLEKIMGIDSKLENYLKEGRLTIK